MPSTLALESDSPLILLPLSLPVALCSRRPTRSPLFDVVLPPARALRHLPIPSQASYPSQRCAASERARPKSRTLRSVVGGRGCRNFHALYIYPRQFCIPAVYCGEAWTNKNPCTLPASSVRRSKVTARRESEKRASCSRNLWIASMTAPELLSTLST